MGRAPTATEIAHHLGIDRELVIEATIASSTYTTWSTDMPLGLDDEQHCAFRQHDTDRNRAAHRLGGLWACCCWTSVADRWRSFSGEMPNPSWRSRCRWVRDG
jgi:hypothetical protein